MARYIDAEKADVESISCFYGSECRIEDVQEWLDEQPTADVVEVKHGEWSPNGICPWNNVVGNWRCSVCNGISLKNSKYCPNCGANMRGDK